MKIFYKKDFQRVLKEKEELQNEFDDYKNKKESDIAVLDDRCFELLEENSKLKDLKLNLESTTREYENEVISLKISIEESNAVLKENEKEKNKLEKKIAKLEENKANLEAEIGVLRGEIADLKSDRYRVRTIPAGRTKNVNKTSIRSSARESRVIKYVKDNL